VFQRKDAKARRIVLVFDSLVEQRSTIS